jgi:hypothetical protein
VESIGNGKAFCKATMDKKVDCSVAAYEEHIGKEAKEFVSPGKLHEYSSKHEGDTVDIDMYRSLVSQVMFLGTKLGPTIGNVVRVLSGFMENPSETHWKALERLIGYLKYMKVKV